MAKEKSSTRRGTEPCRSRFLADFTTRAQRVDRRAWKLIEAIDALAIGDARRELDRLSDMSELTTMRLQHHLESVTKAYETLSNVMKKMSRSSDEIIRHLK